MQTYAVAVVIVLGTATAHAEEPSAPAPTAPKKEPAFGDRGTKVIRQEPRESLLAFVSFSDDSADFSTTAISTQADYFLVPHLSVGIGSHFQSFAVDGGSTISIDLAGTVGYHVPIGDKYSIWPQASMRVRLAFNHSDGAVGLPASDTTSTTTTADLFVPIVWQMIPHVVLGLGPTLSTDLSVDSGVDNYAIPKKTSWGADAMFGVWW